MVFVVKMMEFFAVFRDFYSGLVSDVLNFIKEKDKKEKCLIKINERNTITDIIFNFALSHFHQRIYWLPVEYRFGYWIYLNMLMTNELEVENYYHIFVWKTRLCSSETAMQLRAFATVCSETYYFTIIEYYEIQIRSNERT